MISIQSKTRGTYVPIGYNIYEVNRKQTARVKDLSLIKLSFLA